jgi:hypothetical protein
MSNWPPDKGKANVGLRSGSRSTPGMGWSMVVAGMNVDNIMS